MASFVRITVLMWADMLAWYAMWVMITYLTNVWKLSYTHAAGIVNIWGGIAMILPIGFAFLVDSAIGNYIMLLLSSISYSIGLGFLAMSTPPVLYKSTDTCSEYKPECIGQTQKVLFYTALALIAVGISGHLVALPSFLQQNTSNTENDEDESKILWQALGLFGVVLVPIIGGIALPYIRPWAVRFGIPAICTLVATLLFLSGSCQYKYVSPEGSPVTTMFRVVVATASKISQRVPNDASLLYNTDPNSVPHLHGLRCLYKAAVVLPTKPIQDQEKNRWTLCSVTEVQETKSVIRMIPMWITFIICGVVLSIGNTYFLEQGNHMNRKVGHLTVPLPFFLVLYDSAKNICGQLYIYFAALFGRYSPPIGIGVAMIFSVLCCITAAKVEIRRIGVIRSHGLLDKPNEDIPMTLFWLLPQFLLLAALDGFSQASIASFFANQAPPSMKTYLCYLTNGVLGLGTMGSVLSVYIVGKVSEKGGRPNWFRSTLNESRLDRYYWTLAGLSAVNLVVYILVASFYSYRESQNEGDTGAENPESAPPFEDDVQCCCCCG
ncbi:hypothetical protein LguiA_016365 [Lonicera macranthoides]